MKCPHCKNKLTEIGQAEKGEMDYELSLTVKGKLSSEQDEFCGNGETYFFCRDCGGKLELTEAEVIKILKEVENEL